MEQDTSLSSEAKVALQLKREVARDAGVIRDRQGVRTHVLLVVAMAVVIAIITSLSLLLIRHGLQTQITSNLSQDLDHSVVTFQSLQSEKLADLQQENALLAELPPLKALMTSGDDLTIQDGAVEFWQLSGTDLFALADSSGKVVAAYTKDGAADVALRQGLNTLLSSPDKRYLIHGGSLYSCALRPLYFGSDDAGTVLGYVISGSAVERSAKQISQPSGVETLFLSEGRVVAGTLNGAAGRNAATQAQLLSAVQGTSTTVNLGGVRYLAASKDFSSVATFPLRLVVLKSFAPAEEWITRIDHMILVSGAFALVLGTGLMIILSRSVTRPLEQLSRSVRAFGTGDDTQHIPRSGTQEVRHLSAAFAGMRTEIQQANQALLESERLATIGRMASSVSHDLRHYLATVYANAEFLASDRLTPAERADIFADIRTAVHGTADMIESLLIFSRTGAAVRRSPELLATLLERSAALIRRHPDAKGVVIQTRYGDPTETAVVVDGKQIERAICNLLLNACQTKRTPGVQANVLVTLEAEGALMVVNVIDNGEGVPDTIKDRLFEPFVSEGKQKGTGLGLTLVQCIAVEHGGDVRVLRSVVGETVFQMTLARDLNLSDGSCSTDVAQKPAEVDESVQA